ncbi:MAG: 23S rRNA (uracil(1939)-C(5))-methyltransferase RlmD, partial [Oscillospiraceae bacterium]|nr:23S rRNA (uracil(1939)-C(5))-methyltransferase RlmD [Oscillospiraceae bacterium]
MVKNELHKVHIEQVAMNSMGVGRIDGCVVFVKGALKGEECLVRILKVMKNYAFAKIEEIITPSLHRAESDCPHYPLCGGCDLRHMDYEAELEAKLSWVSDALSRIGGSAVLPQTIYGAGENAKLRNKAIYAVGHKDGKAVAGFYRSRSHDIVPAKRCLLQNEDCSKAVSCVTDWMDKYHIPSGLDGIRHIYIRSSFSRNETLVCPVSAKKKLPALDELVAMLKENVPSLSGVVLHVNSNPGNAVLAGKYFPLWGKQELTDSLLGLDFGISPAAFFQVNPPQTEKLYSLALDFAGLDGSQTVLDLYCGIGTISLCLAKRAKEVIGVEEVAPAIENAIENAKRNNIENARFICCDADKVASQLNEL